MTSAERIDSCLATRQQALEAILSCVPLDAGSSEVNLHDAIDQALVKNDSLHETGWYQPPPDGIGVIFANEEDDFRRSRFSSLRLEEFWPSNAHRLNLGTVALLYASPVDRQTGMIGDFGATVYGGRDRQIRQTMQRSLELLEDVADHAALGMSLGEVFNYANLLMKVRRLSNSNTVTYHNQGGTEFGHTIPWSYEAPTAAEQAVIDQQDMSQLQDLIKNKRRYVTKGEKLTISDDMAFTVEARLADSNSPDLPAVYYHIIVAFKDGQKQVVTGFNPLFDKLNMDFIRSRY